MIVDILPEQSFGGFTHRIEIDHTDLTAGVDTAQVLTPINVGVGDLVLRCASRLIIPFKNSADAASIITAIEVGDGNVTARYLTSTELNENGTEILAKVGTNTQLAYLVADTVDVRFLAPTSGKSLLALDTGKVHIYLEIAKLPAA